MSGIEFSAPMTHAIENELQRQVARLDKPSTRPLHEMLTYHLGWTGIGAGSEAQGKRIRPLLVLLTCASCGTDWKFALPAAAAVELVHNFSLIHDDIQDHSRKRRGRDTVWLKWGIAQGINAGDSLFVLSNLAILDLESIHSPKKLVKAARILQDTCLDLTRGQFLDMSFEKHTSLSYDDYWQMISGKTSALLTACCALGSLLGGADKNTQEAYRDFGHYLGLAFQVQDDYLGVWGDSTQTGKSNKSDMVSGKITLPVIYGLEKKGLFAQRWVKGLVNPDEVIYLAEQLAKEGARSYTQDTADKLIDLALQNLRTAEPKGEAGAALFELTNKLLNHDV